MKKAPPFSNAFHAVYDMVLTVTDCHSLQVYPDARVKNGRTRLRNPAGCAMIRVAVSPTSGGQTRPIGGIPLEDKRISINGNCICCGACEATCPQGAISEKDGIMVVNYEDCLLCCACVDVCPTEAIVIEGRTA